MCILSKDKLSFYVCNTQDIQIRGVNRDEKSIHMAKQYLNCRHFLTYKHSLRVCMSKLLIKFWTLVLQVSLFVCAFFFFFCVSIRYNNILTLLLLYDILLMLASIFSTNIILAWKIKQWNWILSYFLCFLSSF